MNTILNRLPSYLITGFAFLLPVFFLPNVNQPGLIGKQIFLAVFVFLLAGLWVVRALKSGQLKFFWSKGIIFVLSLLLIFGIANIFSLSPIQSFWGMNFEPDTTWCLILYSALFFFCLQFTGENKKLIVGATKGFLTGSLVLAGIFFLQRLGWKFWPWPFMKDIGFNPIGFPQAMVLFLAGGLVFLIVYLTFAENIPKKKKIILFGLLAVFLSVLVLANMPTVWLAFGIALLVLIVCRLIIKKKTWLALGLLAAAIFLFITQWGSFVKLPEEVMISQQESFDIAQEVILNNFRSFLLGTGPATFIFDYDLFHPATTNLTQFWNLRFSQGAAFFPTLLACCGFLGLLAFLGLLVLLAIRVKKAISIKPGMPALGMAVLITCVFYFICWFFYQANSALMAIGFMLLAFGESYWLKEKTWKWSSKAMPAIVVMCLIIFASISAGFYKTAKSYFAAVVYAKAVQEYNSPAGLESAIFGLEKASELDQKDVYFRTLTQSLNLKIKQISSKQGFDKTELQTAVSLAEKAGIKASQLNPVNSQNWLNLAIFYEGLSVLQVQKAAGSALDCLQKAQALSPNNPQIPLMIAKLYISVSQQKTTVAQKKSQFLQLAVEHLKQSLALKSNFSSAYYLLGLAYEMQDQKDLAIQSYQEVLKIEPVHKETLQRLSVLQQQ